MGFDSAAFYAAGLNSFDRGTQRRFVGHGDRVARCAAGRSRYGDAGQGQADDIFTGFDVSVARRAVGVFALRQKREADGFKLKLLRTRQIAHRKSNMVQGLGTEHFASVD
jgi:hypothetical protein